MSDFFSSLLNRHQNTGDTSTIVQPRAFSRFEQNYQSIVKQTAEENIIHSNHLTNQIHAVEPQTLTNSQRNNSQTVDPTITSLDVHQPTKYSEKNLQHSPTSHQQFDQRLDQQNTNKSLISPSRNHNKTQPSINSFMPIDKNNHQLRQTTESPKPYFPRQNRILQLNNDASFAQNKISKLISQSLASQDRIAKNQSNEQKKTANNHSNNLANNELHNSQPYENQLIRPADKVQSTLALKQTIQSMLERLKMQSSTTEHNNITPRKILLEDHTQTLKDNQQSSSSTTLTVNEGIATQPNQANETAFDKKNMASEKINNQQQYAPLEAPSWLPNLATQFNQRIQHLESKAEPVINVTIGRVEVRAVQSSKTKVMQPAQRPTGVMSLNDYLKARDSGAQK